MKSSTPKLAQIKGGPLRARVHHRGRQGCRYGVWAFVLRDRAVILSARGARPPNFSPGSEPGRIWLPQSARFLDIIRESRAPGSDRHHADVGLRNEAVDDQGRTVSATRISPPPRGPTPPRMCGRFVTVVTPKNGANIFVPQAIGTSNAAIGSDTV